jgi:acyl dehydratase
MLRYDEIAEGRAFEPLVRGPITKQEIAGYSQAAADPNPMHVDEEFARMAGYPGIFAQGMLSMGYLGQYVTQLAGVGNVRSLQARFARITWPEETITCRATVTRKYVDEAGNRLVAVELTTENQSGEVKLQGRAVLRAS